MSSVKLVLPPCCEQGWQESVKALREGAVPPPTSQGDVCWGPQSPSRLSLNSSKDLLERERSISGDKET